jgi:anti-anti-sigma factor
LRVTVSAEDSRTRIRLAGELDLATVDQLSRLVAELAAGGQSDLILDLGDLTLCDASGIAVLVAAHDQMELRGGRLTLSDVPPLTREVLRLTGLNVVLGLD